MVLLAVTFTLHLGTIKKQTCFCKSHLLIYFFDVIGFYQLVVSYPMLITYYKVKVMNYYCMPAGFVVVFVVAAVVVG